MLYKSGMEKQEQQFKKDWKLSAVFVVTGLFIGALLTVQFQSSIPSSTFLSDELRAQKDLIDGYVDDQGLLKSKIVDYGQKFLKLKRELRLQFKRLTWKH